MKRTTIALLAALVLAVTSVPSPAEVPERTSTVADRQFVNLTVYNNNLALVHDRRRIDVTEGTNRVAWRDVSANIDSTTTLLDSSLAGSRISVIEQNFDYDLLNPGALLEKYVGRDVVVVHPPAYTGGREVRETARVLSNNSGIVLQYRDRIETDVRGYIIYPSLPPGFRDRPTLVLDFDSSRAGDQVLDLSYLTGGLTWRADYVGAVSADETHLNLAGVITLGNQSGTSYENARLQLVAGNVNSPQPTYSQLRTIAHVVSNSSNVSQESYFEYHLYTLARPTSVLDKQTKQVALLNAHNVPIHKTLELRGSPDYYRSAQPDLGDRLPVGVYITFENKGGELGIPLPAGTMRMYKNDSHGLSQFLGSDNVDHTPRNESVRLHLGDSFDVTAKKRQTEFKFSSGCSEESSYQIVVGNAKDVAQDVLVVEPIPGQWQIVAENLSHTKSSAMTATWSVHVPANTHSTLTYTARSSWCYEGN